MSDFWENVLKFPRFFIASIFGLVLTILAPFLNLLRTPQTTSFFVFLVLTILTSLIIILRAMLNL